MEGVKLDMWGYEVRTSSDSCISAINKFYHQVLSFASDSASLNFFLLVHNWKSKILKWVSVTDE